MVLKPHLASNGCVAIRFKMLTYFVYAPLLNRIDALPLNTIWGFKTIFIFLENYCILKFLEIGRFWPIFGEIKIVNNLSKT